MWLRTEWKAKAHSKNEKQIVPTILSNMQNRNEVCLFETLLMQGTKVHKV